ncbi:YidB family protein [Pandoraea soli]
MGILDSILGGMSGNSADGGSGGGNTKMLLLMGLLAMIANRSGNAQAQGGQGGDLIGSLGGALSGMLGGAAAGGGGAGGLGGLLGGLLGGGQAPQQDATGNPAAAPGDLVGALGGLGGLTQVLENGGLGDAMRSWVGTGSNQPVSADQVTQALGPGGHLQQLADSAGVSQDEAAQQLSSLLPEVVNHLTPNGDLPQGHLDLASLAQQFLGGRTG